MMRTAKKLLALVITVLVTGAAAADPPTLELQLDEAALFTAADWAAYSDRISDALASDHDGLREAALRMTVLHGQNLTLDRRDTIEMVRVFRDHKNAQMRRLAVVALNAADDHWGIEMLARSYRFENDRNVHYQIAAVLLDHAERHREGTVEVGDPRAIVVWPVN